ncbi:MAG: pseudouridine synthase [Acidobacteriaceae bacterium]
MTEISPRNEQRLQKILAAAGIASRRKAEELITQGRVQVNKTTITTLGAKADPQRDHIRVDGKLLHAAEEHRYYMLNKPKGHVTTTHDPQGRPTIMAFFPRAKARLYPVGRLDYHSEGLLLVTNDGALAQTLTRASSHVPKTYLVKVSGVPSETALDRLRRGVSIPLGRPGFSEGRVKTLPAKVRLFRQGDNPWYEVTLTEGRNRQLRKMFEQIGHHVEKIRRVGYGPLLLDVAPGETRELTPQEVRALQQAATAQAQPLPRGQRRPRMAIVAPKARQPRTRTRTR